MILCTDFQSDFQFLGSFLSMRKYLWFWILISECFTFFLGFKFVYYFKRWRMLIFVLLYIFPNSVYILRVFWSRKKKYWRKIRWSIRSWRGYIFLVMRLCNESNTVYLFSWNTGRSIFGYIPPAKTELKLQLQDPTPYQQKGHWNFLSLWANCYLLFIFTHLHWMTDYKNLEYISLQHSFQHNFPGSVCFFERKKRYCIVPLKERVPDVCLVKLFCNSSLPVFRQSQPL